LLHTIPESNNTIECKAQKKVVDELKVQWKLMWSECYNDKCKAEGVSVANYSALKVEQGTIIKATKDFKALDFKDILKQHQIDQSDRYIQPNPSIGGWNKFMKTKIATPSDQAAKTKTPLEPLDKKVPKQQKNGGRGWLNHLSRNRPPTKAMNIQDLHRTSSEKSQIPKEFKD
jgi:hypothetical protein